MTRLFILPLLLLPDVARADAFSSMAPGAPFVATGSTSARAASVRAGEVINALDYGVVCDGSTDNATAYAAIRAATQAKANQTVYFPPAALPCMSSTNLNTSSNTTYRADPGTVTLKATAGSAASPFLLQAAGVSNVLITGVGFDGNAVNQTASNNAIVVFSSSKVVFDRITLSNTRGIGLLFSTAVTRSGARNSTFTALGSRQTANFTASITGSVMTVTGTVTGTIAVGNAVYTAATPTMGATPVTISSFGTGSGGTGTYNLSSSPVVSGSQSFIAFDPLQANTIAAVSFCCGTAANNQDNFFNDNIASASGLDSLSIASQTRFAARGNTLAYPNRFGAAIYCSGNTTLDISNNQVTGAAGNGIDCFTNSDINIVGNHSNNNGAAGIQFASTTVGSIRSNVTNNNWQSGLSLHRGGITLGGEVGDPASSKIAVDSNSATDTQGSPTQKFGFQIRSTASVSGLWVNPDNQFSGNTTSDYGEAASAPSTFGTFGITPATPSSSSAACTVGQIGLDASFVYVCTATNTWKRATLSAF